jgi:phosphatidate cytidylyltransferase
LFHVLGADTILFDFFGFFFWKATMNVFAILKNPYFWAYTGPAAVLLALAWGGLYWLQRQGKRAEDLQRVFWTWVVLIALTTAAVLLGKEVFALVVALLAVFACKEFARATGLYLDWIFTGSVYLLILAVNLVAVWPGYDLFMATPIYAVAALCLLPVVRNRSEGMLQRVALSVMAFVYFGYFLAHLSLLYAVIENKAALIGSDEPARADGLFGYVFFMLYGTATADLAGWLVGRWFGRHPLAPRIASDSTWERAVASLVWAFLWSFTLGWTLPQPQFSWIAMLLCTVLFGMMGPLGDLVMRYILRDLGLKTPAEGTDLIPYMVLGHLHRLIFVAPLFLRLVHWFDPGLFVSGTP